MRLKAAGEEAVYPAPVDLPVVLLPPDDDEDGPPVPAPTSTASSGPVSPDAKDRIGYLGVRMFLKMFVDDVRINDGFIKVSQKKKIENLCPSYRLFRAAEPPMAFCYAPLFTILSTFSKSIGRNAPVSYSSFLDGSDAALLGRRAPRKQKRMRQYGFWSIP